MIINEQNAFAGLLWPANATLEDMQNVVRQMDKERQELREANRLRLSEIEKCRNQVSDLRSIYAHDMQHWEDVLREQKEEQEWCDDGTNEVIRRLNDGFKGGWEIKECRKLVLHKKRVSGTVTAFVEVWVPEGEDDDDWDNWRDEDGDLIDSEAVVIETLDNEKENHGYDYTEVD